MGTRCGAGGDVDGYGAPVLCSVVRSAGECARIKNNRTVRSNVILISDNCICNYCRGGVPPETRFLPDRCTHETDTRTAYPARGHHDCVGRYPTDERDTKKRSHLLPPRPRTSHNARGAGRRHTALRSLRRRRRTARPPAALAAITTTRHCHRRCAIADVAVAVAVATCSTEGWAGRGQGTRAREEAAGRRAATAEARGRQANGGSSGP